MVQSLMYNTIDLDTNDKETVERILGKISKKSCLVSLIVEPSLQKGFHLKMMCSKHCEMCRIVFDDAVRFAYDDERPTFSRNVMFDTKEFFKK